MALTRRQKQVYDFLAQFVEQHGYSPSFEEIGEGLGLSSLATVHKHVSNLEEKGLLKRDYNRSRSIDLLKPRGRMKQALAGSMAAVATGGLTLPLMGRIAAGRRWRHWRIPSRFRSRTSPARKMFMCCR